MNKLSSVIESILFVSGKEVEESFIKEKLEITDRQFNEAVSELLVKYDSACGINLLRFNKKLQFASNPGNAKEVEAVLNPIKEKELTNAMLETLAIVAYKQPVTRLDIEDIRSKDCTYAVQTLMNLGLIQVVGRKETIGKPLLFGTTDDFLKRFSISEISDLPDYETLFEKLQTLSEAVNTPQTVVEKPMFDKVVLPSEDGEAATEQTATTAAEEPVPDFLQGEDVQKVE